MFKNRIKKLEAREGARKMYVFEMKDGLDSGVIAAQFCEENDIDRDEGNLFIFHSTGLKPSPLGGTALALKSK